MNVCTCKTKSSKESMRKNAQQFDTAIDPLVLQMLLPPSFTHAPLPGPLVLTDAAATTLFITRRAQGCKHAGCRRRQERRSSSPSNSQNKTALLFTNESKLIIISV